MNHIKLKYIINNNKFYQIIILTNNIFPVQKIISPINDKLFIEYLVELKKYCL
jgi:hypothetical protein